MPSDRVLTYMVRHRPGRRQAMAAASAPMKAGVCKENQPTFSDATLDRLGLAALQETYGRTLDSAVNRNDPSGLKSWTTPMKVISDPKLTLEAKRAILMNWAWTGT